MDKYIRALKERVEEPGFCRLFYGECPQCSKRLWSVGEEVNYSSGTIRAKFICPCGKKYKQTVYKKGKGKSYRYPQGLVIDQIIKGKKMRMINSHVGQFIVTEKGIKVRKKKAKVEK